MLIKPIKGAAEIICVARHLFTHTDMYADSKTYWDEYSDNA